MIMSLRQSSEKKPNIVDTNFQKRQSIPCYFWMLENMVYRQLGTQIYVDIEADPLTPSCGSSPNAIV
mgnify:CR=1 FL=1